MQRSDTRFRFLLFGLIFMVGGSFIFLSCVEDTGPATYPFPAPVINTIEWTDDYVEITWDHIPQADEYGLERALSSDGTYENVTSHGYVDFSSSSETLSFRDDELQACTEYYYRVLAGREEDDKIVTGEPESVQVQLFSSSSTRTVPFETSSTNIGMTLTGGITYYIAAEGSNSTLSLGLSDDSCNSQTLTELVTHDLYSYGESHPIKIYKYTPSSSGTYYITNTDYDELKVNESYTSAAALSINSTYTGYGGSLPDPINVKGAGVSNTDLSDIFVFNADASDDYVYAQLAHYDEADISITVYNSNGDTVTPTKLVTTESLELIRLPAADYVMKVSVPASTSSEIDFDFYCSTSIDSIVNSPDTSPPLSELKRLDQRETSDNDYPSHYMRANLNAGSTYYLGIRKFHEPLDISVVSVSGDSLTLTALEETSYLDIYTFTPTTSEYHYMFFSLPTGEEDNYIAVYLDENDCLPNMFQEDSISIGGSRTVGLELDYTPESWDDYADQSFESYFVSLTSGTTYYISTYTDMDRDLGIALIDLTSCSIVASTDTAAQGGNECFNHNPSQTGDHSIFVYQTNVDEYYDSGSDIAINSSGACDYN